MPTRYETERDLHDLHEYAEPDREISLGTTTILGIFFALALLCAVFFGFGYSLGRRSAAPAPGTEVNTGSESNIPKPSPGSLASRTAATLPADKPAAGTTQSAIVPLDSQSPTPEDTQPAPDSIPVKAATNPRLDPRNESATKTATKPVVLVPAAAVTSSQSSSVVQVAAMSHQEDADVVAVDLKRRGYTVAVRHEPQDKLFHVQIGPFANKKETDAMRQRLQTDGYNSAIVK